MAGFESEPVRKSKVRLKCLPFSRVRFKFNEAKLLYLTSKKWERQTWNCAHGAARCPRREVGQCARRGGDSLHQREPDEAELRAVRHGLRGK